MNNPLKSYLEGAIKASFGAQLFCGNVSESDIDFIKKMVSKLRESEIDRFQMEDSQRKALKQQSKEDLDLFTKGIKDQLRREGRLE